MDVGKGREQERKLEGDAVRLPPHPSPLPQGEGAYRRRYCCFLPRPRVLPQGEEVCSVAFY